jgi:hypothetical protein
MPRNNDDFYLERMGKALGFSQGGTHPGDGLKPSTVKRKRDNDKEDVSDAEIKDDGKPLPKGRKRDE